MSSLSWITGEIELKTIARSSAEIEQIVAHSDAQISLVHEYIHFLQLVTSVGGIRLLADLVDLGVRGGLLLSGAISIGEVVQGYQHIHPLLDRLDRFAWRSHPGVEERRNETMDELEVMLEPRAYPYTGSAGPWTVVHHVIAHRTFEEPVWGVCRLGRPWTRSSAVLDWLSRRNYGASRRSMVCNARGSKSYLGRRPRRDRVL